MILNCLPIATRIKFKVLTFAYKTTTGTAPIYLNSLVQTYAPSRSSASEWHLVVPSQRGTKSLSWTFSWTVPSWWNDLQFEQLRLLPFSKTSKDTSFSPAPDQLILALTYSILFYLYIKALATCTVLYYLRLVMALVYCCSLVGLIASIVLLICKSLTRFG